MTGWRRRRRRRLMKDAALHDREQPAPVLEHREGIAVVSVLSPEAILLVLLNPRANIGQLLFELRRNREHIAALV